MPVMLRVVNYIVLFLSLVVPTFIVPSVVAEAVLIPTTPTLPASPLMVTAYQATSDGLDLIQIYNGSDALLLLDGTVLKYSRKSNPVVIESVPLSGYMLPNSHVVIAAVDVLTSSERVSFRYVPSGWEPKTLWVESTDYAVVTIPSDLKTDGAIYKRSRTSTGYSTAAAALNGQLVGGMLEADTLYSLPQSPALRFVEVLARAKSCPPFATDPACSDYIKLRVLPGFDNSQFGDYRVRTGSDVSVTNTFSLANASLQGEYLLLRLRDDGAVLSLANGGGYLWLEDAYGLTRYENTLIEYANAGSEKYIDKSWALNDVLGVWQWGIPSPTGPNLFTLTNPELVVGPLDCPVGKYRNPETNRCRSIEEAVNALAACEEGKERNPVTNRCRSSITTATTTFTPCDPGQERNPLTNRCRSVLSANSLMPCGEGQERNPDTNRCRKVVASSSESMPEVKDVKSDMKAASQKWWLAGAAVLLAFGYAAYEWRQEIVHFAQKFTSRLSR